MIIKFFTGARVFVERDGEKVSIPEVGKAGTFLPIGKYELKLFIQRYQRAWVEV